MVQGNTDSLKECNARKNTKQFFLKSSIWVTQNEDFMLVKKERKNYSFQNSTSIFNVVNNCKKARDKILCQTHKHKEKREFQVFRHSIINKYYDNKL